MVNGNAADSPPPGGARVGRFSHEPVRFGPYLLERRIAVGGMSEVYLARPLESAPDAPLLVVKRMLTGSLDDPQSLAAFETEARVHSAAKHPNVVKVFETGEVDGEPYLAMEYVSGVDLFRLMRRAQTEQRMLPVPLAVHVARELCEALTCVHRLRDDAGAPLRIVHRDVTPSNIYLSDTGEVKLGDFGIARSLARSTGGHALKGKYAYLAPEQVSGEPCDQRADLFSLAVVLAELLIGRALFSGAGQLAVLLAIRDCNLEPLRRSAHLLPSGLVAVLERALDRRPCGRYGSGEELAEALAPFASDPHPALQLGLAEWVRWAADAGQLAQQVRGQLESSFRARGAAEILPAPTARASSLRQTVPLPHTGTDVRTKDGRLLRDLTFAKVIELIVTGDLSGDDQVSIARKPFLPIENVDLLARHLPSASVTTHRVDGPGVPDYAAELVVLGMLDVLAWILARRETGALFADRQPSNLAAGTTERRPSLAPGATERRPSLVPGATRKELYFDLGKLVAVASSEPSELFGEYLVRRGVIRRDQLEVALAAMHRYDGRLGDTLIGLGIVDPIDVFRAISSQARTRVGDLFTWNVGRVSFYRGVKPQRVDFRLDLEVPDLMLAGLDLPAVEPALRERFAVMGDAVFVRPDPPPLHAAAVAAPAPVCLVTSSLTTGSRFTELVAKLCEDGERTELDVMRALSVALAAGLVTASISPSSSERTAGSSSDPGR